MGLRWAFWGQKVGSRLKSSFLIISLCHGLIDFLFRDTFTISPTVAMIGISF